MKLFFLRHGKADWPDWTAPDDERPLNPEGIAEMKIVVAALKRMRVRPEVILSSPLPRALRTARLAAAPIKITVQQNPALRPGFNLAALNPLLAKHVATHPEGDLMLVGHEPSLSAVIRALTGARIKLPKAAIAALDLPGGDPSAARLHWLFTAKMLIRLYR